MSNHAPLSPSQSSRWLRCPGSIYTSSTSKPHSSLAADTGTAQHQWAERCLLDGRAAVHYLGESVRVGDHWITLTESLASQVQRCVDWVNRYLMERPGSHILREQFLDIGLEFSLSRMPVDDKTPLFGTSDVVVVAPEELLIADYKFGYQPVDVLTSPQLRLYALGALHKYREFGYSKIRLAILQPKQGLVDYLISVEELLQWRDAVRSNVLAALNPKAPRLPGETQCAWCPGRVTCQEYKDFQLASARIDFGLT